MRVADVACGAFGMLRHELYGPEDGKIPRNKEIVRRRQLVVSAVREIAGASFPDIARVLYHKTHSSEHEVYRNGPVSRGDILAFIADVRCRLREFEPKVQEPKTTTRDARCDGVWFSPACREQRDGSVTITEDEVRSADAAAQPAPELPPTLGKEGKGRGRVQGSRQKDRGPAPSHVADALRDNPPALLDANRRLPRR